MALDDKSVVSYSLASGFAVKGVTADETYIYVLALRTDDSIARIYKYDKSGTLRDTIALLYDEKILYLSKYGSGFVYTTEKTGSGDGRKTELVIVSPNGFFSRSIRLSRRYSSLRGFAYIRETGGFALLHYDWVGSHDWTDARLLSETGSVVGDEVRLPQALRTNEAVNLHCGMVLSGDRFLIVKTPAGRTAYAFDTGFIAQSGDNQSLSEVPSGQNIRGLVESEGQLIVVTDEKFYFYGDPPATETPSDTPSGRPRDNSLSGTAKRQVHNDYEMAESFDLVVPGDSLMVRATNFQAIRWTTANTVDVGSEVEIENQLAKVEILPFETIPSAKIGDYIFISSGSTPSAVPSSGPVWEIKGIVSIGNNYRQRFVCELID